MYCQIRNFESILLFGFLLEPVAKIMMAKWSLFYEICLLSTRCYVEPPPSVTYKHGLPI